MPVDSTRELVLYSYWRSSSAYRVRIALNLKGIEYRQLPVHLVREGGEQHRAEYRAINPLGLVPALVHNGHTLVQSMAICEYLEQVFPAQPLLPADAAERARVRGIAQSITSEIQPLNNLGVINYLKRELEAGDNQVNDWYGHWIARGFSAVESWLSAASAGTCCHGDAPTLADCFLVPQVYNAERFACDLEPYPNIRRITAHCRALPAFQRAAPENQPDAV
ncbi:MAG: maleylacetoacetate isomerase [Xanthomonadales bacterium]|nr:maleylacetoacetate isomerase [Gammaproteobacteria bacterium]MBT8052415.1 maleylacetoacetate isomerase [Gammaproteobacteria bacterium]NND55628.1 maleylacetoacetate isomerase [Xanthomonadales bacterium]NNK50503.1 maleylacetoacetate isomerase [Xanthomonadales bacterium]